MGVIPNAPGVYGRVSDSSQFFSGSVYITGSFNLNNEQVDDAWTSYTPIWTAASSNPFIGNGSSTGQYKLIGKYS